MLHAVADGLPLQQLGGVQGRLKAGGVEEHLLQIGQDEHAAPGAALVALHHVGEQVPVLRLGEGLHRGEAGQAFKAELGEVAELVLAVLGEGQLAVPHAPVVDVPPGGVVGLVKAAAGGGAGRPVEGVRVQLAQHLGDEVLVHADVVGLLLDGAHPFALVHEHLHLVVAAPQAQAGVVAQALYVVNHLRPDVAGKVLRQIVHGAGEHKVLPHHQAQLVADVIKLVAGIIAAAPHPHAVEVGGHALLQQLAGTLGRHAGEDVVFGDVVGAHGEDFHAVHLMGEAFAVLVLFPGDGHGAQADAPLPGIQLLALGVGGHLQGVQGLLPVAVGPPQLGVLDEDFRRGALEDFHLALGAGELHGVGDVLGGDVVQLRPDGQLYPAVLVVLPDLHRGQPGALHAQQGNRPPNAGVGQMGTPVPAEHAVGLAQVGKAPHGVAAAVGRALGVLLPNPPGGGVQLYLQPVLPGL